MGTSCSKAKSTDVIKIRDEPKNLSKRPETEENHNFDDHSRDGAVSISDSSEISSRGKKCLIEIENDENQKHDDHSGAESIASEMSSQGRKILADENSQSGDKNDFHDGRLSIKDESSNGSLLSLDKIGDDGVNIKEGIRYSGPVWQALPPGPAMRLK